MSRHFLLVPLLLAAGVVLADEPPEETPSAGGAGVETAPAAGASGPDSQAKEDAKSLSGMSVLGNQEAPKALVIVPWKSSELGASVGISTILDDSRAPVDREVFMRALSYYEIRSQ